MFNSPLSLDKVDRIIGLLDLPPAARVVDLGCGEGEFLLRVMERYDAIGYGIDPLVAALDKCQAKSQGRVKPERLHLFPKPVADFTWPEEPFDLAICIGATHACQGFIPTLRELKKHVRPNGLILMGDIFWRERPGRDYAKFLGANWPSFDSDFASYVTAAEKEEVLALYSVRSSEEEWDHFEGAFALNRFRNALAKTDPTERTKALEKTKSWRDAYWKWGRSTMGFGFYLYQNTKV